MRFRKLAIALPLAVAFSIPALVASAAPTVPVTDPFSTGAGLTDGPVEMVIDPAGAIYTVGGGTDVFRTDPATGATTSYFSLAGSFTSTLAVDSTGGIYSYNTATRELVYKAPAAAPVVLDTLPAFTSVDSIAVDSLGNVYATEVFAGVFGRIIKYDVMTAMALDYGLTACTEPRGLTITSADDVYVVCKDSWTINQYTAGGAESQFGIIPSATSRPEKIVLDSTEANLYVTDPVDQTVWKVPTNGDPITSAVSLPGSGPTGITRDEAGNLYALGSTDGNIAQISPSGVLLNSTFGVLGAGQNSTAIAVSDDGNLYAGRNVAKNIVKFGLAAALAPPAPGSIPDGVVGVPYAGFTVTPTGVGPFSFAFAAPAPAGLTIDPATGVVSGTPQAVGPLTFTVTVTDVYGIVSQPYTIQVAAVAGGGGTGGTGTTSAAGSAGGLANTGLNTGLSWFAGGTAFAFTAAGVLAVMAARRNRKNSATVTE